MSTRTTSTTPACPSCGGALEVVTDGAVSREWFNARTYAIEIRTEERPFVACTGCEYCRWRPATEEE